MRLAIATLVLLSAIVALTLAILVHDPIRGGIMGAAVALFSYGIRQRLL